LVHGWLSDRCIRNAMLFYKQAARDASWAVAAVMPALAGISRGTTHSATPYRHTGPIHLGMTCLSANVMPEFFPVQASTAKPPNIIPATRADLACARTARHDIRP
jgi:hypothetical protein